MESPPRGRASAESAINYAPPLHDVFPLLRECLCALGILIYRDDAVGLGLQGWLYGRGNYCCMRSDTCHKRRGGGGGGVERQYTATPTPPLFSADSTQAAKSSCALLLCLLLTAFVWRHLNWQIYNPYSMEVTSSTCVLRSLQSGNSGCCST